MRRARRMYISWLATHLRAESGSRGCRRLRRRCATRYLARLGRGFGSCHSRRRAWLRVRKSARVFAGARVEILRACLSGALRMTGLSGDGDRALTPPSCQAGAHPSRLRVKQCCARTKCLRVGRLLIGSLVFAFCASSGSLSFAQRRPVLPQIDLPHPYYYREMYLPQLTSGPSSVAWSPDSREVVYSMAGSLWRQKIDAGVAQQITDGLGYDYQPDWSPDGKSVVYVSYREDAMELWLLDLASGTTEQLTKGQAVNVEPRWSPD